MELRSGIRLLISFWIAIVLLVGGIGIAWAQSPLDISVGSGSGLPDDTGIGIPVSMDCTGTSPVSSLQFNLNFDPNTLINPAVTPGSASASKTVDINSFTGYERVVIYGGRSLMPCGELVNVSFDVASNAPGGQTDLTLSDYVFSDPDAVSVAVNIHNGSFQVPTPSSTPTPTSTNTPTPTSTSTSTPGPSATASNTPTPSNTPTTGPSPTPSNTSPPTATHTPGPSPTASSTPSGTLTPSPTATTTPTRRATTTRIPTDEGAGAGLELEGAAAATGTALAEFEGAVAATSTALAEEIAARPTDEIITTGPSSNLLLRPELLAAAGLLLLAIALGGGAGYLAWRQQEKR